MPSKCWSTEAAAAVGHRLRGARRSQRERPARRDRLHARGRRGPGRAGRSPADAHRLLIVDSLHRSRRTLVSAQPLRAWRSAPTARPCSRSPTAAMRAPNPRCMPGRSPDGTEVAPITAGTLRKLPGTTAASVCAWGPAPTRTARWWSMCAQRRPARLRGRCHHAIADAPSTPVTSAHGARRPGAGARRQRGMGDRWRRAAAVQDRLQRRRAHDRRRLAGGHATGRAGRLRLATCAWRSPAAATSASTWSIRWPARSSRSTCNTRRPPWARPATAAARTSCCRCARTGGRRLVPADRRAGAAGHRGRHAADRRGARGRQRSAADRAGRRQRRRDAGHHHARRRRLRRPCDAPTRRLPGLRRRRLRDPRHPRRLAQRRHVARPARRHRRPGATHRTHRQPARTAHPREHRVAAGVARMPAVAGRRRGAGRTRGTRRRDRTRGSCRTCRASRARGACGTCGARPGRKDPRARPAAASTASRSSSATAAPSRRARSTTACSSWNAALLRRRAHPHLRHQLDPCRHAGPVADRARCRRC